jgi:hydroxymethylpyrimidine pyrophosphatase-like HAD family hydrolase
VYVSPEELCVEPACKIEFHYDPAIEAAVEAAANAHPDPRWIAVRTFPGTIEFMDPRVNKRNALLQYCGHRGIELQDVIACGDMESDIEMMKGAGLGICLKNGSPAAREAADAVTDLPVNEDGLGIYLLSHM